jgi:hypothetical protein
MEHNFVALLFAKNNITQSLSRKNSMHLETIKPRFITHPIIMGDNTLMLTSHIAQLLGDGPWLYNTIVC